MSDDTIKARLVMLGWRKMGRLGSLLTKNGEQICIHDGEIYHYSSVTMYIAAPYKLTEEEVMKL